MLAVGGLKLVVHCESGSASCTPVIGTTHTSYDFGFHPLLVRAVSVGELIVYTFATPLQTSCHVVGGWSVEICYHDIDDGELQEHVGVALSRWDPVGLLDSRPVYGGGKF